jgi:hypothetical protein
LYIKIWLLFFFYFLYSTKHIYSQTWKYLKMGNKAGKIIVLENEETISAFPHPEKSQYEYRVRFTTQKPLCRGSYILQVGKLDENLRVINVVIESKRDEGNCLVNVAFIYDYMIKQGYGVLKRMEEYLNAGSTDLQDAKRILILTILIYVILILEMRSVHR